MNIAIIDDEDFFAKNIEDLIKRICKNHNIPNKTDVYHNGYNIIENYEQYHVLFLDIDMPALDGLEVARRINLLKKDLKLPLIVFVTNKDNLVFDALKQFPYYFIRKSCIDEDVEECIVRIYNTLNDDQSLYSIKVGRTTVFVNLSSIIYLEKEKNYIIYHTTEKDYSERGNMDDKSEELIKKGFIRTHVGYFVNAKHISEIKTNTVVLDNKVEIPISKKFKNSVKETYLEWLVKEYA